MMRNAVKLTSPFLENLYKYLVAALLIFIPLYPKFPLFNVPFTYVAIRAEDFLIAIVTFVLIIKFFTWRKIKFPSITPQILIYLFIGLVSSISAILITKNVQPLLVLLHYFRRWEYILAFFLLYFAGKNEKNKFFYLELIFFPVIGVFLYGIAQLYFNAPVISTMDSEASKGLALVLRPGVTISSTFAGHYDLAVYLAMILIYLASITSSVKKWSIKSLLFIIFGLVTWLFMQTGSRISLGGLYLSIFVIAIIYKQYLTNFILASIVTIGILTTPQFLARFESIFSVFLNKTTQVVVSPVFAISSQEVSETPTPTTTPTPTPEPLRAIQQDRSTSIRFDVEWPRALRSFYKNPFLGTGYSSLTLATDNDYLRSIGETGLLGLLAFVSILVGLGKTLLKKLPKVVGVDKVIIVSSLGILLFFSTTALFLDVFEASKIAILFWSFMGLAVSIKTK